MYDLILHGVTLVRPEGLSRGDVAVEGGRIARIEASLSLPARQSLNAEGRILMPGLVDPHVHLRTPGATHKEDFHTGTLAAVSGGITSVIDMPNTSPPTTTRALLAEKRALVSALSVVDFGLFLGATPDNLEELQAAEESENYAGIKIFMGASTGSLLVADEDRLRPIFEQTRALISVHAEDDACLRQLRAEALARGGIPSHSALRPPFAAARAVRLAVELAQSTSHPLHICHASTAEELEVLYTASPTLVSVEASPHHLLLDESLEQLLGNYAKVNPPLRTSADQEALWQALDQGRITVLGTDHAPHLRHEKEQGYWEAPSGIPHLDTSLISMLYAVRLGRLSLERLVAIACENPARRYGLEAKGRLEEGYDADLVLLSGASARPLTEADLYTRCGWSPFLGWKLPPKPEAVWVRGTKVAERGQVIRPEHRGRELQFKAPWR